MDDILLLASLDEHTALCVSPLSADALSEAGFEPDDTALFLYESVNALDLGGIRVLARVPDVDAAHRLAEVFKHAAA